MQPISICPLAASAQEVMKLEQQNKWPFTGNHKSAEQNPQVVEVKLTVEIHKSCQFPSVHSQLEAIMIVFSWVLHKFFFQRKMKENENGNKLWLMASVIAFQGHWWWLFY